MAGQAQAILAIRQAIMKAIGTPQLSIVIVNYGSWPDVISQTEVIQASRPFQAGQLELIVVDNHSPGGPPPDRPQMHGLTWLDLPDNGGFAAGVNAGWQSAKAGWLLLLNPDVNITANLLSQVLALLDETHASHPPKTDIGIIGIGLTNPDGSRQPSVGVRTELMQQLNGFDQDYFLYFEETDFCHRARLRGWRTGFEPDLSVCHQKPLQNRAVSPMIRLWTRHSRLVYFRKNRPWLEFRIMLAVVRIESAIKARLARFGLGLYPAGLWIAIHQLTSRFLEGTEPRGTLARDWAWQVVQSFPENCPNRN